MGCRFTEKFRGMAVLAAASMLGGCGFKIAAPAAGTSMHNPILAEIDWSRSLQSNTFKVVVDPTSSNQDVTSAFAVAPVASGYAAKGTLPGLPDGTHTLKVSGDPYVWYTGQYSNTTSQSRFEVIVQKN